MARVYADMIRYGKINPKTHKAWDLEDVPIRNRAEVKKILEE